MDYLGKEETLTQQGCKQICAQNVSRPDRRERFMSLFWFGQGVIWVGSLMFYDFLFLCVWPGVVLNQRQLSIVDSD